MAKPSKTVLQFGTGRFLRSFVDLFIHEANRSSETELVVIAVQSTGSERARKLSDGPFHVAIRGVSNGKIVDSVQTVEAVRRGVSADEDWDAVIQAAEDESLSIIVSNTTEAGLSLDAIDSVLMGVPSSYPAKLLAALLARYEAGGAGLTILPCELVDRNAQILRDLVVEQANIWDVDREAISWVREENRWCNTLVDRIVSAPPDDHPLYKSDPLLSVAEPFAFWAIESGDILPFTHPAIECVDDVSPFSLRKVRILNGAHTALVERAGEKFVTVREAMAHQETRDWLESLVTDEIVPCVEDRVDGASQFARDVFERFENPFLDHRLADIALHQAEKVKVRLLPTYNEYRQRFGKPPTLLGQALAQHL